MRRRKTPALIKEKSEDSKMQDLIINRADYSIAILGKAFETNGSGRFLNIRVSPKSSSSVGRRSLSPKS